MKNFKVKVQSSIYNSETDSTSLVTNKVYIIQRVVRSELDTIIQLHKEVLIRFLDTDANMGEFIRNNESWELLKTLAKNLNILGQKEKGFDLEEIADDLEQICQIFISQSMSDEGVLDLEEGWKPSLLADLHKLDFPLYMREAIKKYQEKREEKKE